MQMSAALPGAHRSPPTDLLLLPYSTPTTLPLPYHSLAAQWPGAGQGPPVPPSSGVAVGRRLQGGEWGLGCGPSGEDLGGRHSISYHPPHTNKEGWECDASVKSTSYLRLLGDLRTSKQTLWKLLLVIYSGKPPQKKMVLTLTPVFLIICAIFLTFCHICAWHWIWPLSNKKNQIKEKLC